MKRMLTNRFCAAAARACWCASIAWFCIVGAAPAADDAASGQPDLKIAPAGGEYRGDQVYTATGLEQTIECSGSGHSIVQYWIAVQNDGNVGDCFLLRENPHVSHSKWVQRYYDACEGGNDASACKSGNNAEGNPNSPPRHAIGRGENDADNESCLENFAKDDQQRSEHLVYSAITMPCAVSS